MFWALLVVAVVTSNPPGPIALTGGALSMVVLESMDRGMVGGNGIVVAKAFIAVKVGSTQGPRRAPPLSGALVLT